jgi:hypothetical protein
MSRKLVGILIIIVGVLLSAGIIYILFFNNTAISDIINKFKNDVVPQKDIIQYEPEESGSLKEDESSIKRIIIGDREEEQETTDTAGKVRQITKEDLRRMAASFSERFGSYSNQSNFSNIIDLKIFMSQDMKKWADQYVSQQRQEELTNDIYYGITTKAIAQEVVTLDDDIGQAIILVKTRRREAISSTSNISNVFDQDIIINLTRERGAWKVSSASWQDK